MDSPSQSSDAVSDVHSISDIQSETGGIDSDDYMMYDLCTCGRAHKRDCIMNFRKRRLPLSPGESKPDTARSRNPGPPSVSPEPECVVIDDVSPPPTEQARPQIKVVDYVASVFSRNGRTATSCTAEGVCIPGPFWGVCTDHTCQKQPLVCCVHCWLWNWGRPCVRQLV